MGLSTVQLRLELREHLGITDDTATYDDSWCDLLLNKAFWEIQDKFGFKEKEATVALSILTNTYSYTLSPSTLESLRVVSVLDPNTSEYTNLDRLTDASFLNGAIFDTAFKTGKPENYYRENHTLYIYPVPDQNYTASIKYRQTLTDLGTSSDLTIPQSWHEIILYGAVWRGFVKLSDMQQSQTFRQLQADLINTAVPVESKEEVNTQHAGVYVYGYDDYT